MDPTAIPIYTYNIKDDHPFNDLYNKLEKQVEEDFKYIYYDYHRKQFYFISNEKDEKKRIPIPEGDIFDFVYSNEIDEKKRIPIPEYLNLLISEEEVPALAPALALAAPAAPFVPPAAPAAAPTPSAGSGAAPAPVTPAPIVPPPSAAPGLSIAIPPAGSGSGSTPTGFAAHAAVNATNTAFIDTIFSKNYSINFQNNKPSAFCAFNPVYMYYYPPIFNGWALEKHLYRNEKINLNEDEIISKVTIWWEYYFASNFKEMLYHILENNDLNFDVIQPLLIYLYIEDEFNKLKKKISITPGITPGPDAYSSIDNKTFDINFTENNVIFNISNISLLYNTALFKITTNKNRQLNINCSYSNNMENNSNNEILSWAHPRYKFVNHFGHPLIRAYIFWIKYYNAIPDKSASEVPRKGGGFMDFLKSEKNKLINLVNKNLVNFIDKVNVLSNNDVMIIIPQFGQFGNVLPKNITDDNNIKTILNKVKECINKNFDKYKKSFNDKINNYINVFEFYNKSFITSGGAMSRGGNGGNIIHFGNWHEHNIQKINIRQTSNDPYPQTYYLFPHDPNNYYVFPSHIIPWAPIISLEDQPRVLESTTDWQEYANRIRDGGTTSGTNLPHFNATDGKDSDNKKIRKAWDVVKEDGIITYKRHNGYFEMTCKQTSDENIYSTKLEIKFFKFINNDIIKLLKYDKEPTIEKDSNDVTKENINLIDIDDTDITIIILNNLDNEQGLSLIYDVKFKDIFFSDNKKLINKIFAKIYNHSQDKVDNDIYIFFNVKIENIIKTQSNIIITNKNHKKNFKSLNEKLKNIISYYKTINQLIYFDKYMNLELYLLKIIKLYILIPIPKEDIPANVPQNSYEEYSKKILDFFKNELALRHSICDDITLINKNKNIDKYKKILRYTYNNIDTYYINLTEVQKKTYISDIATNSKELKKKIRYYGKTFIN